MSSGTLGLKGDQSMAGLVVTCGFSSLNILPWGSWEGAGQHDGP